jgi:membrane-bound serine protease (ClpP class)
MAGLTTVVWIVLLLVFGLLLICAEVVLPGAIVGIVGALMVLGSVLLVFVEYGTALGTLYLFVAALLTGLALKLMVRALVKTQLGNIIVLKKDLNESKSYADDRSSLLGKTGEAFTDLRPAGTALLDGQRSDVVTEGLYVSKGKPIQVISVEGARIVVREMSQPGNRQDL